MRPAGAAIEPARNAGAIERVLEQADIVAGRSQHHRDLVEAHTGARLLQDPARDLDALAALARRGEEPHFAGRLAFRRLPSGEQVASQRREIGAGRRLEDVGFDAERFR